MIKGGSEHHSLAANPQGPGETSTCHLKSHCMVWGTAQAWKTADRIGTVVNLACFFVLE